MINDKYSLIISKSANSLNPIVKKQLNYMNPTGASNRKLPYSLQRILLDNAGFTHKVDHTSSPIKLPYLIKSENHLSANPSSPVKKLVLSRDTSPKLSLPSASSQKNIQQINGIVESCEKITKLNKSDLLQASKLGKKSAALYNNMQDYVAEKSLESKISRMTYRFKKRKANKASIDRIIKETNETTYFVERKLHKNNSSKKIRERTMPWKKVIIYGN